MVIKILHIMKAEPREERIWRGSAAYKFLPHPGKVLDEQRCKDIMRTLNQHSWKRPKIKLPSSLPFTT